MKGNHQKDLQKEGRNRYARWIQDNLSACHCMSLLPTQICHIMFRPETRRLAESNLERHRLKSHKAQHLTKYSRSYWYWSSTPVRYIAVIWRNEVISLSYSSRRGHKVGKDRASSWWHPEVSLAHLDVGVGDFMWAVRPLARRGHDCRHLPAVS